MKLLVLYYNKQLYNPYYQWGNAQIPRSFILSLLAPHAESELQQNDSLIWQV